MRLLTDECTSGSIVTALQKNSFDIVRVVDLCAGDPDEIVLGRAFTDKRVLLTEDKDFGELTIRLQLPSVGVVIVVLPDHSSSERAERVVEILTNSQYHFENRLTVIEPQRIRQRSLES